MDDLRICIYILYSIEIVILYVCKQIDVYDIFHQQECLLTFVGWWIH